LSDVCAVRAVATLVLVALVAGCGGSGHTGGNSQFGAAPAGSSPSAPTSESPSPTDDVPAFNFSPGHGPSASGPGPASNGAADLRASYHVDKGLLGATSTVSVTLTNQGTAAAQGWTVIMGLSGVTLGVSTPRQVKHETRDGQHVFTPNGTGGTISPGDTLGFSFTVTGLGSITSCAINGRDCTTA
jgi:hypothetical protein